MKILTGFLCLLATAASALAGTPEEKGEIVYRDNCTRCHMAMPSFSPRVTATVVQHMQVRAMLTRPEEAAVLRYLLEAVESTKAPKTRPPAAIKASGGHS